MVQGTLLSRKFFHCMLLAALQAHVARVIKSEGFRV